MLRLLYCEYKKFKGTYITIISIFGMLSPLLLVTLMYMVRSNLYKANGTYNWYSFNNDLNILLIFLVGPIITSFISVFSIFYEYHGNTMKNLVASPHSRLKIIISKLISVSLFVLIQYLLVAILNTIIALLLRFNISINEIIMVFNTLIVAGILNLLLIPFMMFLSLLFKNFVPALFLTIIGTISNALVLNWEHSYLSPWSLSANFVFIMRNLIDMNILYPLTSATIYSTIFLFTCILYFKNANQPS